MAQTLIDFDLEEEEQIKLYSQKWGINKPRTIQRMIKEFQEVIEKDGDS